MTEISQFKVDLNHPILVHPFYKTYYAVELSTNHKFRADYIKEKIVTDDQISTFNECCEALKESKYYPTWLPFHDGIITSEGQGILLWRCNENLISLREAITTDHKSLSRPTCIRNLGLIAQALKNAKGLDIEGHLRLTIDNILIDPILDIPILTRYGFHKLWLELYGESGKIPTLICPPEMINEDQSEITFNEKLISIYDSYAFGVLMYEILTKQILNEEEPFDRNLIDANLQGSEKNCF